MALTDRLTPENEARLGEAESPPPGQEGIEATRPRRGRKPGSTRGASKSVIESTVASALVASNALIAVGARFGFLRADDMLTGEEIAALTDGVTAEAMAHPRVNKWISAAAAVSPHVTMANALIAVALPRMMRRGLIPSFTDRPESTDGLPVSMEAGRAHGSGGGYGEREVYAPSGAIA